MIDERRILVAEFLFHVHLTSLWNCCFTVPRTCVQSWQWGFVCLEFVCFPLCLCRFTDVWVGDNRPHFITPNRAKSQLSTKHTYSPNPAFLPPAYQVEENDDTSTISGVPDTTRCYVTHWYCKSSRTNGHRGRSLGPGTLVRPRRPSEGILWERP